MKYLASPRWLVAGCALILLTNLALLAGAGANRRDAPRTTLLLTERELGLPAVRLDEGRILDLSLRTALEPPGSLRRAAARKRYPLPQIELEWMDRAKLGQLGFPVEVDPRDSDAAEHYARMTPRRVYLVLEYDGDAWKRWIHGREDEVGKLRRNVASGLRDPAMLADAEAVLSLDRTMRSHLVPIDAGRDPEALERRSARGPCLVVMGLVRPRVVSSPDSERDPYLTGDVLELFVGRVHVPRGLREPLDGLLSEESWRDLEARERREAGRGWPSVGAPRFDATLAVGHRYEPWLVETRRID